MTSTKTNFASIKGNWFDQRNKLKAKFKTLTNEDLYYEEGKKEEMLKRIQLKLGKTKEEFAKILNDMYWSH